MVKMRLGFMWIGAIVSSRLPAITAQIRIGIVLCATIPFFGLTDLVRGASPLAISASTSGAITAPLSALSTNPNYFSDGAGKAVYLTGSHTWNDFQDWGTNEFPVPFDFAAYVNLLVAHNHNFTLLWQTELPRFCGLPTTASSPPDFSVTPLPWQRSGPGNASDGKPKFDLTKFNPTYFDRLRATGPAIWMRLVFTPASTSSPPSGSFVFAVPVTGIPLRGQITSTELTMAAEPVR